MNSQSSGAVAPKKINTVAVATIYTRPQAKSWYHFKGVLWGCSSAIRRKKLIGVKQIWHWFETKSTLFGAENRAQSTGAHLVKSLIVNNPQIGLCISQPLLFYISKPEEIAWQLEERANVITEKNAYFDDLKNQYF